MISIDYNQILELYDEIDILQTSISYPSDIIPPSRISRATDNLTAIRLSDSFEWYTCLFKGRDPIAYVNDLHEYIVTLQSHYILFKGKYPNHESIVTCETVINKTILLYWKYLIGYLDKLSDFMKFIDLGCSYEETSDTVRDTSKTYYKQVESDYVECTTEDYDTNGSFKEGMTYFEKVTANYGGSDIFSNIKHLHSEPDKYEYNCNDAINTVSKTVKLGNMIKVMHVTDYLAGMLTALRNLLDQPEDEMLASLSRYRVNFNNSLFDASITDMGDGVGVTSNIGVLTHNATLTTSSNPGSRMLSLDIRNNYDARMTYLIWMEISQFVRDTLIPMSVSFMQDVDLTKTSHVYFRNLLIATALFSLEFLPAVFSTVEEVNHSINQVSEDNLEQIRNEIGSVNRTLSSATSTIVRQQNRIVEAINCQ